MNGTVAVTGIGLVTPAGVGREDTWRGILAGRGTAAVSEALAGLPVDFCCSVPDFAPDRIPGAGQAWRLDRYAQFALTAAHEAVADSGLVPAAWEADRVGVVIGSAAGGVATLAEQERRLGRRPSLVSPLTLPMFLPNMAAGELARAVGARGPCLQAGAACASGAVAVAVADDLLRSGACDIVLAGGADAMATPLCVAAFARMGALSRHRANPATASRPFDADRDGFVIGEGAGVLVLERAADARARGARAYALLTAYANTCDAYDPVAPRPDGAGLRAALRQVLAGLREEDLTVADIDHVNAHGTSTPANDRIEAAALADLVGDGALVTSTKGVTGHLMGAAGAVEIAVTALALSRGVVPPTANHRRRDPGVRVEVPTRPRPISRRLALSVAMGFGGHNTVWALHGA